MGPRMHQIASNCTICLQKKTCVHISIVLNQILSPPPYSNKKKLFRLYYIFYINSYATSFTVCAEVDLNKKRYGSELPYQRPDLIEVMENEIDLTISTSFKYEIGTSNEQTNSYLFCEDSTVNGISCESVLM